MRKLPASFFQCIWCFWLLPRVFIDPERVQQYTNESTGRRVLQYLRRARWKPRARPSRFSSTRVCFVFMQPQLLVSISRTLPAAAMRKVRVHPCQNRKYVTICTCCIGHTKQPGLPARGYDTYTGVRPNLNVRIRTARHRCTLLVCTRHCCNRLIHTIVRRRRLLGRYVLRCVRSCSRAKEHKSNAADRLSNDTWSAVWYGTTGKQRIGRIPQKAIMLRDAPRTRLPATTSTFFYFFLSLVLSSD